MRRILRVLMFTVTALSMLPALAQAQDSAQELSLQAQEECDLGRVAQGRAVRLAHFEKGQALAERAITLDERNADGHFALFCSLGEQLRIDGESLSSAFRLPRVMRELDRTLELDPDHVDAMSSKGTFLIRLPGFLGGDAIKGEHLLRQVIQREPHAVNARISLARACAARGDYHEALEFAAAAVAFAHERKRHDLIPEAQATLAEITHHRPALMTAKP